MLYATWKLRPPSNVVIECKATLTITPNGIRTHKTTRAHGARRDTPPVTTGGVSIALVWPPLGRLEELTGSEITCLCDLHNDRTSLVVHPVDHTSERFESRESNGHRPAAATKNASAASTA